MLSVFAPLLSEIVEGFSRCFKVLFVSLSGFVISGLRCFVRLAPLKFSQIRLDFHNLSE